MEMAEPDSKSTSWIMVILHISMYFSRWKHVRKVTRCASSGVLNDRSSVLRSGDWPAWCPAPLVLVASLTALSQTTQLWVLCSTHNTVNQGVLFSAWVSPSHIKLMQSFPGAWILWRVRQGPQLRALLSCKHYPEDSSHWCLAPGPLGLVRPQAWFSCSSCLTESPHSLPDSFTVVLVVFSSMLELTLLVLK